MEVGFAIINFTPQQEISQKVFRLFNRDKDDEWPAPPRTQRSQISGVSAKDRQVYVEIPMSCGENSIVCVAAVDKRLSSSDTGSAPSSAGSTPRRRKFKTQHILGATVFGNGGQQTVEPAEGGLLSLSPEAIAGISSPQPGQQTEGGQSIDDLSGSGLVQAMTGKDMEALTLQTNIKGARVGTLSQAALPVADPDQPAAMDPDSGEQQRLPMAPREGLNGASIMLNALLRTFTAVSGNQPSWTPGRSASLALELWLQQGMDKPPSGTLAAACVKGDSAGFQSKTFKTLATSSMVQDRCKDQRAVVRAATLVHLLGTTSEIRIADLVDCDDSVLKSLAADMLQMLGCEPNTTAVGQVLRLLRTSGGRLKRVLLNIIGSVLHRAGSWEEENVFEQPLAPLQEPGDEQPDLADGPALVAVAQQQGVHAAANQPENQQAAAAGAAGGSDVQYGPQAGLVDDDLQHDVHVPAARSTSEEEPPERDSNEAAARLAGSSSSAAPLFQPPSTPDTAPVESDGDQEQSRRVHEYFESNAIRRGRENNDAFLGAPRGVVTARSPVRGPLHPKTARPEEFISDEEAGGFPIMEDANGSDADAASETVSVASRVGRRKKRPRGSMQVHEGLQPWFSQAMQLTGGNKAEACTLTVAEVRGMIPLTEAEEDDEESEEGAYGYDDESDSQ